MEPHHPLYKQLLRGVLASAAVLVAPGKHVPPTVRQARYVGPLVIIVLVSVLAAWSVSRRLDVSAQLAQTAEPGPTDQQQSGAATQSNSTADLPTDAELQEQKDQALAIARLKLGAGALLGTPARLLLWAVALWLLARFTTTRAPATSLPQWVTVSSIASLPHAIHGFLIAGVALLPGPIDPAAIDTLIWRPSMQHMWSHPLWLRFWHGIDVFAVWSVVLAVFGFAELTSTSRRRATLIVMAAALFALLLRFAVGGGAPR